MRIHQQYQCQEHQCDGGWRDHLQKTAQVHHQQKENGVAVIFVGEDLDVLIELCDRILVISSGKVSGIVEGRKADKGEIGLMMTKADGGAKDEN